MNLPSSFVFFPILSVFFSRWNNLIWIFLSKHKNLNLFNIISTFTLFVYSLTYFITLWHSLDYSIKLKKIDIFLPCILLSCVEIILAIYFTGFNNEYKKFADFSSYYHSIYIIIESIIISIFYFRVTSKNTNKSIIMYLLITIFLSLSIAVIFKYFSLYLGLVIFEFFMVNVNALSIYFMAIKNNKFNIRTDELIISNGLFIFINFTAPYFIIDQSVDNYSYLLNPLKFINSIGYCIFCFTNILAIKWKIKNSQIS